MSSSTQPTLVFDGDCDFCKLWIARWRAQTGEAIEYAPYQEAASRFPQITIADFRASVHLIEAEGRVSRGAEAVFRSLTYASKKRGLLWAYYNIPGFRFASEFLYKRVARNRVFFSWLTFLFWGEDAAPSTYFTARSIFLRLLAFSYLVAFVSFGMQARGLIGSNGILPVTPYLEALSKYGAEGFALAPSLAWINSSDATILAMSALGAILSVLLLVGRIAPALVLFGLWLLYLSLISVGREFYAFQWDNLLLEVGFLSIFFAPFRKKSEPSHAAHFALLWLLFRLMFSSGVVKLASDDPSWWNLTALTVHYETQPLPTWIGWYAHQLPAWFQKASAFAMFAIEIVVPFFVFFPRRFQLFAFVPLAALQVLILLTGNYCFFNALTLALCFLLLDDRFWRRKPNTQHTHEPSWKIPLVSAVVSLAVFLGSVHLAQLFLGRRSLPPLIEKTVVLVDPLRTFNSYGLFAVMTTVRNEIVIEGSYDGKTWLEYEFPYKPGDVMRPPGFIAPYQPRLDWQMWFAALGTYENNPWLQNLMIRILQGAPEVLALFAKNPFAASPPTLIRAQLYQYHFTNRAERAATGAWWKRESKGVFSPVLSLSGG